MSCSWHRTRCSSTDPRATIERPGLLGAYTYAGAAPVINVDPTGLDFFGAHQRVAVKARAQEAFDLDQFALKISGEGDLAQKKADQRQKLLDKQASADAVREPNALIKIDLNEGTVSLGPPYGPRKEWKLNGGNSGSQAAPSADAQDSADSKSDDSLDATDDSGGPNAGDDGSVAGSARVSVSDADGEADQAGPGDDSSGDGDEASASQNARTGRPTTAAVARPARRRRRRRQPRRQLTDDRPDATRPRRAV